MKRDDRETAIFILLQEQSGHLRISANLRLHGNKFLAMLESFRKKQFFPE
jgi:hypothetical protein